MADISSKGSAPVNDLRAQGMFEKKAALFLADGCEEIEALTPADLLYRAAIPVTTVSVMPTRTITSLHGITITADKHVSELDFDDYDMLILPGGVPGTPNLAACRTLTDQILRFASEGKMLAAICAAPSILADLGILSGRHATCNPSKEDVLRKGGALLTGQPVCVDGNIITSQAMGTAIPFSLAIIEHYLGKDTADKISRIVLYT